MSKDSGFSKSFLKQQKETNDMLQQVIRAARAEEAAQANHPNTYHQPHGQPHYDISPELPNPYLPGGQYVGYQHQNNYHPAPPVYVAGEHNNDQGCCCTIS